MSRTALCGVGCLLAFAANAAELPWPEVYARPSPVSAKPPAMTSAGADAGIVGTAPSIQIFYAPEGSDLPAAARGRFQQTEAHAVALALIETHKAEAAYQQLSGLEERYSGDVEYDYLYGLAALESGHASEAVFSLQRASRADGRFAAARLEFARALYATGDDTEAAREFRTLLQSNPPPEAAVAIRAYLAAIDERAARYEPRLKGAVELEAGYDSNANSGTRAQQFLSIPLDVQSRESASGYAGVALSGLYSHPLTPRLQWRSSLRLGHREYPEADFVSSSLAVGSSELGYRVSAWDFSLGLQLGAQFLRDDLNQSFYGLGFRVARPLLGAGLLSAGLRAGLTQYGKGFNDAEVQQRLADLGYRWQPADSDWQAEAGAFYGQDDGGAATVFTRDFHGLQLGGTSQHFRYPLRATGGWLSSRYERIAAFPERREDEQLSVRLSSEIAGLYGKWVLTPQLSFVDNQSSLGIYDYQRVDAGISISRGVP